MSETDTIDGLKATLVRALELGDAKPAASLYEGARVLPPGAPVITGEDTDIWNSDASGPVDRAAD